MITARLPSIGFDTNSFLTPLVFVDGFELPRTYEFDWYADLDVSDVRFTLTATYHIEAGWDYRVYCALATDLDNRASWFPVTGILGEATGDQTVSVPNLSPDEVQYMAFLLVRFGKSPSAPKEPNVTRVFVNPVFPP
jgi:hypothetical protein